MFGVDTPVLKRNAKGSVSVECSEDESSRAWCVGDFPSVDIGLGGGIVRSLESIVLTRESAMQ